VTKQHVGKATGGGTYIQRTLANYVYFGEFI
jgi:hypothetical protein